MRTVEQWVGNHRATWEKQFDRLGDVLEAHLRTVRMSVAHADFTIERQ